MRVGRGQGHFVQGLVNDGQDLSFYLEEVGSPEGCRQKRDGT